jgi:hypothetical protein
MPACKTLEGPSFQDTKEAIPRIKSVGLLLSSYFAVRHSRGLCWLASAVPCWLCSFLFSHFTPGFYRLLVLCNDNTTHAA